jgi:hypothetical protein
MKAIVFQLAAIIGMMFCLAFASPASASYNDQFPCKSDHGMSVLVSISADDSNIATLQVVRESGDAHTHEMLRKPGGSWEDFRYEDDGHHIFVGGSGKGVLLMHGKSFACAFVGEPEEEDEAGTTSHVLLNAEGLDIAAPGISLPDGLSFGASEAEVIGPLSQVLGEPSERETNNECGAGPMSFRKFGRLWLNFSKGEWVGWFLDGEPGDVPITLEDGVTIGSPAGELASAADYYPDSSLGDEFYIGGISGLSAGKGSDASIDALWAGTNCLFR